MKINVNSCCNLLKVVYSYIYAVNLLTSDEKESMKTIIEGLIAGLVVFGIPLTVWVLTTGGL